MPRDKYKRFKIFGGRIPRQILENLPTVKMAPDFDRIDVESGVEVPACIVAIMLHLRDHHARQVADKERYTLLDQSLGPDDSSDDSFEAVPTAEFVQALVKSNYNQAEQMMSNKTPDFAFDTLAFILYPLYCKPYTASPETCHIMKRYDLLQPPPYRSKYSKAQLNEKRRTRNLICAAVTRDVAEISSNKLRNLFRCVMANLVKLIVSHSKYLCGKRRMTDYPTLDAMSVEPFRMETALDYIASKLADRLIHCNECVIHDSEEDEELGFWQRGDSLPKRTLCMLLVNGAMGPFTAGMQLGSMVAHTKPPDGDDHPGDCICMGLLEKPDDVAERLKNLQRALEHSRDCS